MVDASHDTQPVCWTADKAWGWHAAQPLRMGCNYTPAYAVNQLEMWQAESFDISAIDRELALAASAGLNSLRVYLHDLLWAEDAEGFARRLDKFLAIAASHGHKVMLVLFDSCWHPEPQLGPQPDPIPGVHNSRWVQSPGMPALRDARQHPRLRRFVEDVVGRFATDQRILAWDIWNEPDNGPLVDSCDPNDLGTKGELVLPLLREAFGWARAAGATQPLTSAIWLGDWSDPAALSPLQLAQLALSDVISFHNYGDAEDFARRFGWLQQHGRPILCTEFMARPTGSRLDSILPLAADLGVASFCWGLVRGRTQTHLPWDSWQNPRLEHHDGPWFHDLFDADHSPHDPAEIALIQRLSQDWAAAEAA
jgi:hypothetical protein